ncbi:hypothetical protein V8E55_007196 [Tylopilus felleus]
MLQSLKAPHKKRWLPKSKCPDLCAKAPTNCKNSISRFFNAVLLSVKQLTDSLCRRWNAKSSTTPLKGYGLDSKRKPDISLFEPNSNGWPHLVAFCEVKSKADTSTEKKSYIELAGKSACLLFMQDSRHIAPSICILGSSIYSSLFDRGGSISTCGF